LIPGVQFLTHELIGEVIAKAHASPRRRMNHNFHSGPADNPHRFLNVLLRGTYVRPHRHLNPPKAEAFLILSGEARCFLFDDSGAVTASYPLRALEAVDLAPGLWHTIVAISEEVVCYEVKPGPWDPATDKDFAPWAPEEGSPDAAAYLRSLELAAGERLP
jgi:cupin fold WbuC family metalloprotein